MSTHNRAEALELAIRACGSSRRTVDIVDTAAQFEEYLNEGKKPDPKPTVLEETQLVWALTDYGTRIGKLRMWSDGKITMVLTEEDHDLLFRAIGIDGNFSLVGLSVVTRPEENADEPA